MNLKGVIGVNRKILLTVLALAVVLLATPYIGMAHATSSTTVSGVDTLLQEDQLKVIPLRDGYQIMVFAVTERWWGDNFDATGSTTKSIWLTYDLVLPPPLPLDYKIYIIETLTFQGTVLGKSGTFIMALYLHFSSTEVGGCWVILSGTGGLAHLRGQGTISSPAPYYYTFAGQVHF
jgi:Protein of unknown function (DUF3224)